MDTDHIIADPLGKGADTFRACAKATISNTDLIRHRLKTIQTLGLFAIGQFKGREPTRSRIVSHMESPIRASTAGCTDCRPVYQAQHPLAHIAPGTSAVRESLPGKHAEPVSRTAQALQQGNVGKLRDTLDLRPGSCLSKRHATGTIAKSQTQQSRGVTNFSASYQCSGIPCRSIQIRWLANTSQHP